MQLTKFYKNGKEKKSVFENLLACLAFFKGLDKKKKHSEPFNSSLCH